MSAISKAARWFGAGAAAVVVTFVALVYSGEAITFAPAHTVLDLVQSEATWHLRGAMENDSAPVLADAAATSAKPAHPPIPASPIRTCLLICHLLALVLAMGSALLLDAYLFSRLYRAQLELPTFQLIEFGGRVVEIGLALLWLSGLGFVAYYYFAAPDALANQKLWAKIVVVCCLTLNGFLIHQRVVPSLRSRIGKPILAGLPMSEALLFLGAAALSSASWLFAFTLGLVKELNFAFSASTFLAAYLALVSMILAALMLYHRIMSGENVQSRANPASNFGNRHGYRLANGQR